MKELKESIKSLEILEKEYRNIIAKSGDDHHMKNYLQLMADQAEKIKYDMELFLFIRGEM